MRSYIMNVKLYKGIRFLVCAMFIVLIVACPMPEPEPTPPGTMAAPTLEAGNGQIIAAWTAPTDTGGSAITAYHLRHNADGGTTVNIFIEVPAPAAAYTITGLTNGAPYQVQVRAVNAQGDGDWSGSAAATPVAVPMAPTALTFTVGENYITAAWTAPTDNGGSDILRYELEHREADAPEWEPAIATADADTLTLTIPGLTKGTEYDVQVYAVNAEGNGNPTEILSETPVSTPDAPNAPTLTPGKAQIAATWNPPADNGGSPITGYELQYREFGVTAWENASGIGANTTHTITELKNSTTYEVRVRAVNTPGTGDWSAIATATPLFATPIPSDTLAVLSDDITTLITDENLTVKLTVVEPGTLVVNEMSGAITVTPVTLPDGVTPPAVNASTGVITVTANTTAGTYLVYGENGSNVVLFAEYFYVTESPQNRTELEAAVTAGISTWGQTADLNYIITTAVRDMSLMFKDKYTFNGDISLWDVSSVTNIGAMFRSARAFNGDLSGWDVSSVTNMANMFTDAHVFNGDISAWNTGAVTDMSWMFAAAKVFNIDISVWDVGSVTDMANMFNIAAEFNYDISEWDVSSVTNMDDMFREASAFNQNLNDWAWDNSMDPPVHWNNTNWTNGTYNGTKSNMFLGSGVVAAGGVGVPMWYQ